MRQRQLRLTEIVPSRWRLVKASASARIGRSKLRLTPRLLMNRVAHFIRRMPMPLYAVFCCKRGSIVGEICSSRMLRTSGKKRKSSFVIVRQRLMRSRTTQREYALDLKLRACSDAAACAGAALFVEPGLYSNISTVKARF